MQEAASGAAIEGDQNQTWVNSEYGVVHFVIITTKNVRTGS